MNDPWKFLETSAQGLHTLLLRLTLRHDLADDLMQELIIKLTRSTSFATANNPGAYARRTAINLAMDSRRQTRRAKSVALPLQHPADANKGPAITAEEADDITLILDAAETLSESVREPFILRYVQDETYEAIGEILGKTAHQVRALCHAGIKQVRERLAQKEVLCERNQ